MTQREKAIVTAYTGISMVEGEELGEFYKYVDELFGRPVYTHELYLLADEIKKRSRDDFIALCRKTDPGIVKCKEDNYIKAKIKLSTLYGVMLKSPLHVHRKMSNKELVVFLSEQFAVSRTTAKDMLHGLMKCKLEDNFKKQFSGRKDNGRPD